MMVSSSGSDCPSRVGLAYSDPHTTLRYGLLTSEDHSTFPPSSIHPHTLPNGLPTTQEQFHPITPDADPPT